MFQKRGLYYIHSNEVKIFYAYTVINNGSFAFQDLIMNCSEDRLVDHINWNTMDNSRWKYKCQEKYI